MLELDSKKLKVENKTFKVKQIDQISDNYSSCTDLNLYIVHSYKKVIIIIFLKLLYLYSSILILIDYKYEFVFSR